MSRPLDWVRVHQLAKYEANALVPAFCKYDTVEHDKWLVTYDSAIDRLVRKENTDV